MPGVGPKPDAATSVGAFVFGALENLDANLILNDVPTEA